MSAGIASATHAARLLQGALEVLARSPRRRLDRVLIPAALGLLLAALVLVPILCIVTIVATGHAKSLGAIAIGGGGDPGTEIRNAARFELLRRVEAGTLRVIIDSAYPLADAAAALEELASGHAHGKIILTV